MPQDRVELWKRRTGINVSVTGEKQLHIRSRLALMTDIQL